MEKLSLTVSPAFIVERAITNDNYAVPTWMAEDCANILSHIAGLENVETIDFNTKTDGAGRWRKKCLAATISMVGGAEVSMRIGQPSAGNEYSDWCISYDIGSWKHAGKDSISRRTGGKYGNRIDRPCLAGKPLAKMLVRVEDLLAGAQSAEESHNAQMVHEVEEKVARKNAKAELARLKG